MGNQGRLNSAFVGRGLWSAFLLAGAALPVSAWAADDGAPEPAESADEREADDQSNSDIVVQGVLAKVDATSLEPSPKASIASVYSLTPSDIEALSVTTPNELLRNIPGVSVADLGNGGIPNGVTIRGWGLVNDGTSVRSTIDGYARNIVSGGNNNGSNDLNILIPELIQSIDVIKGPFDTRYSGNFAYAGSAIFTTADYVPNRVSVGIGSFGRQRILATLGHRDSDDRVKYYVALEGLHERGRRENNRQDKINLFAKLTVQLTPNDELKVTGQLYSNHYGQPGYIRSVLIDSGAISEKDASDPNAKGWRDSGTVTAELFHRDVISFDANIYVERLENYRSINRQDRSQVDVFPENAFLDKRWTLGGGFHPWVDFNVGGIEAVFRTGAEIRADLASVDRYPAFDNVAVPQPTPLNARTGFFSYSDFKIYNPSLYAEISLKPAPWIKVTGGVRDDWFIYNVKSTTYVSASNSLLYQHIKESTDRPTLHGGIAITPFEGLTLIGNFGEGITSTNVHTQLPLNPELRPTKLNTKELALRYNNSDLGVSFDAGVYHTLNQGELGVDPRTGITVNLGESVRKGYDISGRLRLFERDGTSVTINANYNEVEARLKSPTNPANIYVTGTPPWTAGYGIDAATPVGDDQRIRFSLQHNFLGSIALTTNGGLKSDDYDRLAAKLSYEKPGANNLRIWIGGVAYNGDRHAEMATTITVSGQVYRVTNAQPPFRFESGIAIDF